MSLICRGSRQRSLSFRRNGISEKVPTQRPKDSSEIHPSEISELYGSLTVLISDIHQDVQEASSFFFFLLIH